MDDQVVSKRETQAERERRALSRDELQSSIIRLFAELLNEEGRTEALLEIDEAVTGLEHIRSLIHYHQKRSEQKAADIW